MLIPCPVCGRRDLGEFTYFGDASSPRPDMADQDQKTWAMYVYDRENPRGPNQEFWHHTHGCRNWMIVTRSTVDHDISGSKLAGAWGPVPPAEPR